MKTLAWILLMTTCVAVSLKFQRLTVAQEGTAKGETIGYVRTLKGKAYVKQNARSQRAESLSDYHPLQVGQVLTCERGSTLIINLPCQGSEDARDIPVRCNAPFTVTSDGTCSTEQERTNREQLDKYAFLGGRKARVKVALSNYNPQAKRRKGDLSTLFSPANLSAVSVSTIALLWNPRPTLRSFSITVEDSAGNQLWQGKVADGSSGRIDARSLEDLKHSLIAYRDSGKAGELILKLLDARGVESQQSFSLLSVKEEADVRNELAAWETEGDSFIRYLGRIYTFNSHKMYNEAAYEYDSALEKLPNARRSPDLLLAAIDAQSRVGNSNREKELVQLLPPGTKLP
jgi:hypothetical protein